MRRIWRRLGAAAAAGFVVLLLVLLFRKEPVRIDVGRVSRGMLVVTVDEDGETRVRDRYVLTAPISGRVARITLEAGDPVERGSVVARMNPLPLDPRTHAELEARIAAAEAAVREAEARQAQARAALEQAQRTAARARQLGVQGTISREERELAELAETARGKELEAAEFSLRAALATLEAARAALLAPGGDGTQAILAGCERGGEGCLELRSPIDGSVLRVPEKSERVVTAGTPLLELGDPRVLEIVVDVLSTDAVGIAPGAQMQIEEWGGSAPLDARVRVVEPSGFTKLSALGVEEQRVNVIGDFDSPPAALGDGYRVEARIVVWQGNDVLKVPSSALFRRDEQWSVFVVDRGRARRQPVEIGRRNAQEAEVREGLAEGTAVILHPSDQVDDGVRVEEL